jgi:hypothetical protein
MLREPAHFVSTRATPPPQPGLRLAAPGLGASAWVFGTLVVDEPDVSPHVHEGWARAVMLHAYADEEPEVRSRGLVGPRALLVDPLPARAAGGPLVLPFAVDLRALLGETLQGGWFVWATAREHASATLHLKLRPAPPDDDLEAAVLGPDGPPERSPAEALVLGRAHLGAGQPQRADAHLTAALKDDALKADLEGGAIYDAACAAARVSALAQDSATRQAAGARALSLLRDDVQRAQKALAAHLQAHVLGSLDRRPSARSAGVESGRGERAVPRSGSIDPLSDERQRRLAMLMEQEVVHLRWARDEDPDLASIRPSVAFAAIFRAEPRARATGKLAR